MTLNANGGLFIVEASGGFGACCPYARKLSAEQRQTDCAVPGLVVDEAYRLID